MRLKFTPFLYSLGLVTACLLSSPAFAQIQINSITSSRVGNYEIAENQLSATVWGGLAGGLVGECASPSTTSTCNNCAADDTACNDKRIHENLVFQVSITVTGDISGTVQVGFIDGSAFGDTISFNSSAGTLSKGQSATVTFDWGQICTKLGAGSCIASAALTDITESVAIAVTNDTPSSSNWAAIKFYLHYPNSTAGIDVLSCSDASPSSGICFLHASPGDQKVYIQDLQSVGGYPSNNTVALTHLRIFISETNYASANYLSNDLYVDLDIPDDGVGEPTPGIVDGLENNKVYFFRPAVVDKARNIAFLAGTDLTGYDDSCPAVADMTTAVIGDDHNCKMIAEPLAVYGLLTEDLNCFISTAAFGSSMSKEVQTFRSFRNRYMMDHPLGVKFRRAYYKYGPQAANYIHNHPWMKPIARAALYPALVFSKISLEYGIHKALQFTIAAFALLIMSLAFTTWSWQQWSRARS